MRRNFGTFTLDAHILDDLELAKSILSGCVVTRCEHLFHRDALEYIALHEDFDEVPLGSLPIEYEARFRMVQDEDGEPTKREFLGWKKK